MPLITPPFRTSLLTANGVPFATDNGDIQTTRDWWLYWNQLTDRSNANSKLATAGTHAERPMPESMPDGALYYENDRGVLYASTLGVWQYVAGVMWGTLSPDQRPTDLGTHDAGFDFRTIVAPAREFIWSQAAWIEVTPVQYGPHAARPDPATIVEGALYVESDRDGVIYQVEKPAGTPLWQYLAGTMFGTLSPDQRPTDLGTHDAGFDFRTSVPPARQFIWSQTAWIEVTPSPQTPWASNIDAASHGLANVSYIGVGMGAPVGGYPFQVREAANQNVSLSPTGGFTALQAANDAFSAYVPMVYAASAHSFTNGNVGIGLTGPTFLLQLNADSAGKPATSTWSVVSDIRLKQNIEPVRDDSLAILAKLDWIRYEYNGRANTPLGVKGIGLDAQTLREHLPEAVRSFKAKLNESDSKDSEVLTIDYHHILVHSARAIRQLAADVERLKAIVES